MTSFCVMEVFSFALNSMIGALKEKPCDESVAITWEMVVSGSSGPDNAGCSRTACGFPNNGRDISEQEKHFN